MTESISLVNIFLVIVSVIALIASIFIYLTAKKIVKVTQKEMVSLKRLNMDLATENADQRAKLLLYGKDLTNDGKEIGRRL